MFSHTQLFKIIRQGLTRSEKKRSFCIAYSGGLDSHVLLNTFADVCRLENTQWKLRAVHINHGLSPNADLWAMHCKKNCAKLNIPYQECKIDIHRDAGESLEAASRKARYTVFSELLKSNEYLVTAHTQDDQAETLLLQLMRGAGIHGLSAMPFKKRFSIHYLLRPFLTISRSELQQYAIHQKLRWIEDDSNQDLKFNRNYLRLKVIPLLRNRWPAFSKTVSRSARYCAESSLLLQQLAVSDLEENNSDTSSRCCHRLRIKPLLRLGRERQRNVLRYWIRSQKFNAPSCEQLKRLQHDMLYSRNDAIPYFKNKFFEIRRYQQELYLLNRQLKHNASNIISWNLLEPIVLPSNLGSLYIKKIKGNGIKTTIHTSQLSIRFRQGGECFRLSGQVHRQPLKKLMQKWGIPPWQRDRIPLLYENDKLIAIVGYGVCEGYAAQESDDGYEMILK